VKRRVYVDTGYFVALLDRRDDLHTRAVSLARELQTAGAHLTTSDAVLVELANYCARGPLRSHAVASISAIRGARDWTIAPFTTALLKAAEARYAAHDDKNWSLTDCLSMEVMTAARIQEIATHGAGFEQAGYRVLLR
jgi:uncharacterized protein